MEKHIQILAILYIIGGILTLAACGFVFILVGGSGLVTGDETALLATGVVSLLIFLIGVVYGLPNFVAGWGLLKRKSWSRILTIILGILNLVGFPLGTALGIYTLWVLLKPESEKSLNA